MPIIGQEYLVKFGVDADWSSVNKFFSAIGDGKLKALAMKAAFVAAGTAIYKFVESSAKAEFSLIAMAKKQRKAVEEIRAGNTALKAMGMSLKDIKGDKELKRIYDGIVKINEGLALPKLDHILGVIRGLQERFWSLKSVVMNAMQWIGAKLMTNLEAPIKRISGYFKKFREWITNNMNRFTSRISGFLTAFGKGLVGVVKAAGKLVAWFDKLPNSIKGTVGAIALITAALSAGPIGLLVGAVTLIGDIIHDYDVFMAKIANPDDEKLKELPVAFQGIWEAISGKNMDGSDNENAGKTMGEKIAGVFDTVSQKISEKLREIVGNIKTWLESPENLAGIKSALSSAWEGMKSVFNFAKDIAEIIGKVIADTGVAGKVRELFAWLQSVIQPYLDALSDMIYEAVYNTLGEKVAGMLGMDSPVSRKWKRDVQNNGEVRYDQNGRPVYAEEMFYDGNDHSGDFSKPQGKDQEAFAAVYEAYRKAAVAGGWLHSSEGSLMPYFSMGGMSVEANQKIGEYHQQALLSGDQGMLSAIYQAMNAYGKDRNGGVKPEISEKAVLDALGQYAKAHDGASAQSSSAEPSADRFDDTAIVGAATTMDAAAGKQSDAATAVKDAAGSVADASHTLSSASGSFDGGVTRFISGVNRLMTAKVNALGGRYDSPTYTSIAEDNDPEYIIPIKKEGRAFPLIRQMLTEMGSSAVNRIMGELGMGRDGTVGASFATAGAGGGGIHITNHYNVSAPVTIVVNSSSVDARQVGAEAYSAASRSLLRTLKGVISG